MTTETGDLSHITAEMDTSTDNGLGKKDIKLRLRVGQRNKAEIEANFQARQLKLDLISMQGYWLKVQMERFLKRFRLRTAHQLLQMNMMHQDFIH